MSSYDNKLVKNEIISLIPGKTIRSKYNYIKELLSLKLPTLETKQLLIAIEYNVSIHELIKRSILNDYPLEAFMTKMTDEEINNFYLDINLSLKRKGIKKDTEEYNSTKLAIIMDIGVIYGEVYLKPY